MDVIAVRDFSMVCRPNFSMEEDAARIFAVKISVLARVESEACPEFDGSKHPVSPSIIRRSEPRCCASTHPRSVQNGWSGVHLILTPFDNRSSTVSDFLCPVAIMRFGPNGVDTWSPTRRLSILETNEPWLYRRLDTFVPAAKQRFEYLSFEGVSDPFSSRSKW